ncbi:MAG: hypothetical protein LKM30_02510 [Bacilli bacterium]|jgi:hypothetical protein|nr:hypothetical protein [Bacilli bacterium]
MLTPSIKEGYYLSDVEMNYDNIPSSSMSTSSSEYTKTITFTMEADNLTIYFTCTPLRTLTIAADSHVTAVQAYLDYERTEPVSTYNPYVRIFLLFTTKSPLCPIPPMVLPRLSLLWIPISSCIGLIFPSWLRRP